jgi:hypothetical protein
MIAEGGTGQLRKRPIKEQKRPTNNALVGSLARWAALAECQKRPNRKEKET